MRDLISTIAAALNKAPVPLVSRSAAVSGGRHYASPRGQQAQLRAFSSNGTLFGIVDRTSTATAAVGWHLYRKAKSGKKEDRVEVTDHACVDLWNKPNKFFTQRLFVETEQQHLDLTGEGWTVVARNKRFRIPLELWPVPPHRMRPVVSPTEYLVGYIYTSPDGEDIPLAIDDVIPMRRPDPDNPYRGLGPVQASMRTLDAQRYAEEWNRNFFTNGAEPGGIIEVEERLSDDEFNEFRERWAEAHQGIDNAHRVAILENKMKWVDRKYSMRDMQFVELARIGDDKLFVAFGVSKTMLGLTEGANRAIAESGKVMFAEYVTVPRLDRIKDMLNYQLLPLYGATGEGLEWDYDDPVPPDAEARDRERTSKASAFETYVKAGVDGDSLIKPLGLPEGMVWKKPEPAPTPGQPGTAKPGTAGAADGTTAPPTDDEAGAAAGGAQDDVDWGLFGGSDPKNVWPPAWSSGSAAWNPAAHPRDRRGRFTKSRTTALTDGERQRGRDIIAGFKPRKFGSAKEATDYINSGPKLTKAQAGAVDRYTGDGFLEMNRQLRSSKPVEDPDVDRLRSAMSPLEDDLILTRVVGLEAFGNVPLEDLVGKKVKDAAFSSTSLNSTYGGGLSGVTMQIAVPKGTMAVLAAPHSRNPSEREVILADGLEFAVASVEPNGLGGYRMSLITLTPGGADGPQNLGMDPVVSAWLVNAAPADEPAPADEQLEQVQADWEAALAALLLVWAGITAAQKAELLAQITAAVTAGTVAAFAALTVTTTAAVAALTAAMTDMGVTAARQMVREAAAQGRTVPVPDTLPDMAPVAEAVAKLLGDGLAQSAGKEALRVYAPGVSAEQVGRDVRKHLDELSDAHLREQLGGALSRAQNVGRLETVRDVPQTIYTATEVLDRNTCKPCKDIDGTVFDSWLDAWQAYAGGVYHLCLGRWRCRGTVTATWNPEAGE